MSQTLVWPIPTATVVRFEDDGSDGQGCGGSKRLYVGRAAGTGRRNYRSYLKPTVDWTGVGKIISATLVVYTDDHAGSFGTVLSDTPTIRVKRLTDSFTEGNNADGVFDSGDFTSAAGTNSDNVTKVMAEADDAVNRIDITAIVEDWAPSTVLRRSGAAGGKATVHGIGLFGFPDTTKNWSGWSDDADDSLKRPTIELVYELGPTVPTTPSNLTPAGAVASIGAFQADFADAKADDTLAYAEVQVFDAGVSATGEESDNNITRAGHGLKRYDQIYFTSLTGGTGLTTFTRYYVRVVESTSKFRVSTTEQGDSVDITVDYSAMTYSKLVWTSNKVKASETEVLNDRSNLVPENLNLKVNTNYRWRVRHYDQEGQVSAFSSLVTFSVTNTNPNAPTTLTPASGFSASSLNGIVFRGRFTDPNVGDTLLAFQVQLSEFAEGDVRWLDADFLLWDTGKVYTPASLGTTWDTLYGGAELTAGTYYWRARQWDNHDGVSEWAYSQIILTADFDPEPGTQSSVQQDRRAPWRIVIKDMHSNGLRGPGTVVAILENAKSVGASQVYNSPGEVHFTLPVDHPQIAGIEPKQTHYSLQFYTGDGWRETFAGLVWDADANEKDVVFTGIDYLALLDYVLDERYFPEDPDRSYTKGGSKYVDKTIRQVVVDQLTRATKLANSPVGFMTLGSIATMNEKVTIWSTMQPTLSFVGGLLDSHRQGQGKKTRIEVKRTSGGAYQIVVTDAPGQDRDNLRLKYGEIVQGYRVIFFGKGWASVQHSVGRTREGIRVLYKTENAPGISQTTYGRIAQAAVMDGVSDENDLIRRTKQAAIKAGKLGRSIALGIRSGFLKPLDGYAITDSFPVSINHGAVNTEAFGSGYWDCFGVVWEAGDDGEQIVNLTLMPREDTTAPDADLIPTRDISPQAEWQLGWTPPDPLKATSKYWLDQSTGKVYLRDDEANTLIDITGTV